MKKDLKIISKGLYSETAENPLLAVKQYIFARENGKKCLLLRFENKARFIINYFEFWLVQKNSDGVEIAKKKMSVNEINARPGEIFSPEKCFLVQDKCVDFDIKIVIAKSGKYEYRLRNGEIFVRYPMKSKWSYLASEKTYSLQYSKLNKRVSFTSLILIVAIISVLIAMVWPFISDFLWPAIQRAFESMFDTQ